MRGVSSIVAAIVALAWTTTAQAVPTPGPTATALAQVPDSACVVVHLRGYERTLNRFEALVKNVSPELHKQIEPFFKDVREGFDGRPLKELVADGSHFAVFFNLPPFEGVPVPKFAVVLRTKRYRDFRDSFLKDNERKGLQQEDGYESTIDETGSPLMLVDRKEYTVLTPDKEVAQLFAKKFKSIDERISAAQSKRLLDADLGVLFATDLRGKDYADDVKAVREIVEESIEEIDKLLNRVGNPNLELARGLIKPLFQAVEDSQGMLLAVDFRPTGLALHLETEPRKGSATARGMKEFATSGLTEMDDLPRGLMTYTAWHGNAALVRNLGTWLSGVPTRTDGAFVRPQREALDTLVKGEPGVRAEAFNPLTEGVQSWAFADPAKAATARLTLLESLRAGDGYHGGFIRKRPTITRDDQKHGDITLHRVQIGWDIEKMVSQPGMADLVPENLRKDVERDLRRLIGEDTNVWLGHDGKRVVQVTARDWKRAEELLAAHLKRSDPLGKEAGYAAVRKEMPAEATFLMVADLPRYVDTFCEVFREPLRNRLPNRPLPRDQKAGPAWVGLALALREDRGSADVFVSAEAIRELVRRYLLPSLR